MLSGEGGLLSYSNDENDTAITDDQSVGIEIQPDAIAFGTLGADTALTTNGFPIDNDEFDLDHPTEGFSSIPDAIEDIRQGKVGCFWLFFKFSLVISGILSLFYLYVLLLLLLLSFCVVFLKFLKIHKSVCTTNLK